MPSFPPTHPEGMDGNRMGEEIAAEIVSLYGYLALGSVGYVFSSAWFVPFWQAVGRAIVAHIQNNQVVITPVIDYQPGLQTTEFPSNEVR